MVVTDNEDAVSPRLVGLSIEPARASPRDLVLQVGTSRFECILELDHPECMVDGGALDAVHTLDCWLSELDRLSGGDSAVVLLPFNFSDQCTGWLRVGPARDRLVEVQAGWSNVSQYDLTPADLTAAGTRIRDFTPVRNARIERSLDDIIAAVAAMRRSFAAASEQTAES